MLQVTFVLPYKVSYKLYDSKNRIQIYLSKNLIEISDKINDIHCIYYNRDK